MKTIEQVAANSAWDSLCIVPWYAWATSSGEIQRMKGKLKIHDNAAWISKLAKRLAETGERAPQNSDDHWTGLAQDSHAQEAQVEEPETPEADIKTKCLQQLELERWQQELEAKASMTNPEGRRHIVLVIEDILSDFT